MIQANLPKKGARVVVAMSGGVDSSVAAGWLKAKGYDVIGISLQLHDIADKVENKYGTCCSLSDLNDARRVAERLEIPFYVNNLEVHFQQTVISDFISEYLVGRTPNPCVKCNEKVKFRELMDWALDLGADFLATGHYAQNVFNSQSGQFELHKGQDTEKDQSYFLFPMKYQDLSRTIFPVGDFDKPAVRVLAKEYGLAVADKPDSQEICFVQAKSYREYIEENVPKEKLRPGNVVDREGNVLGAHPGIHQFTIGQRKGIGLSGIDPVFVLELRSKTDEVVVGPESALFRKSAKVSGFHWINEMREGSFDCMAKIRYRAKETPVKITALGEKEISVQFENPQRAVTPGQALVLYEGTRVLGGGWIENLSLH